MIPGERRGASGTGGRGGLAVGPLRRELRPLYLCHAPIPPVVALSAYFDESWFRDDPGQRRDVSIVAIAGYIGDAEMWDAEFAPAWARVIRDAPHPIREFKTSDCRQGNAEFAQWSREERDGLTRAVVAEITDPTRVMAGVGAVALIDHHRIRGPVPKRAAQEFGYFWCLLSVVNDALRFAREFLGDDHLQIVFDEARDLEFRAQKGFHTIRADFPDIAGRVRSAHFAPSHTIPPLQAADLLAYETHKEIRNRLETPPRTPSAALRRLVEGKPHIARFYDLSDVAVAIQRYDRGERDLTTPSRLVYRSPATDPIARDWPLRRPSERAAGG